MPLRPISLSLFDLVAHLDADRRQMAVERLHAEAVVDDHAVAVDAQIRGMDNDAPLRGLDRHLLCDGEIEAEVHLAIDFLPHVRVGAEVGELRFDRGVAQRLERLFPHHLRRGLPRELGDGLGVPPPQVAVDA